MLKEASHPSNPEYVPEIKPEHLKDDIAEEEELELSPEDTLEIKTNPKIEGLLAERIKIVFPSTPRPSPAEVIFQAHLEDEIALVSSLPELRNRIIKKIDSAMGALNDLGFSQIPNHTDDPEALEFIKEISALKVLQRLTNDTSAIKPSKATPSRAVDVAAYAEQIAQRAQQIKGHASAQSPVKFTPIKEVPGAKK